MALNLRVATLICVTLASLTFSSLPLRAAQIHRLQGFSSLRSTLSYLLSVAIAACCKTPSSVLPQIDECTCLSYSMCHLRLPLKGIRS